MKTKNKRLLKKITAGIWDIFLSGLIAILPLTLTLALLIFAIRLLKHWLEPLHAILPEIITMIPHSEILVGIIVILCVGVFLKFVILRPLIHAFEALIFKIPLIRPIYSGIKQLVHGFSPQDTQSFKDVVLVEFPRKGAFSIGFVTNEALKQLSPDPTKKYMCVFIPTTPNPTTGFFIYAVAEELIHIDLTRQEAMALIISGGIVQPDRFMLNQ